MGKLEKVTLLKPRGFCAGVSRAVKTVQCALEKYGAPIYVLNKIVHNERVVSDFETKGVIFVSSIEVVPQESVLIFSAHGVSPAVRQLAREKNLKVIDATCPFVQKVHQQAIDYSKQGYQILFVGDKQHDEAQGVLGEANMLVIKNEADIDSINQEIVNNKLACLTQTTLEVDEARKIIERLKVKFPYIKTPVMGDVCYATQNRQRIVKMAAKNYDAILVIGSTQSNNSQKLVSTGLNNGCQAYLINDVSDIVLGQMSNYDSLAITAGASTPESLVNQVLEFLQKKFPSLSIDEFGEVEQNIDFKLPEI